MAVADIVEAFRDDMLPHLDVGGVGNPGGSLLYQLLLKGSSNDKRFVIEEAKRALALTAGCVTPVPLLELLLPYAAHKSPKVSHQFHNHAFNSGLLLSLESCDSL